MPSIIKYCTIRLDGKIYQDNAIIYKIVPLNCLEISQIQALSNLTTKTLARYMIIYVTNTTNQFNITVTTTFIDGSFWTYHMEGTKNGNSIRLKYDKKAVTMGSVYEEGIQFLNDWSVVAIGDKMDLKLHMMLYPKYQELNFNGDFFMDEKGNINMTKETYVEVFVNINWQRYHLDTFLTEPTEFCGKDLSRFCSVKKAFKCLTIEAIRSEKCRLQDATTESFGNEMKITLSLKHCCLYKLKWFMNNQTTETYGDSVILPLSSNTIEISQLINETSYWVEKFIYKDGKVCSLTELDQCNGE